MISQQQRLPSPRLLIQLLHSLSYSAFGFPFDNSFWGLCYLRIRQRCYIPGSFFLAISGQPSAPSFISSLWYSLSAALWRSNSHKFLSLAYACKMLCSQLPGSNTSVPTCWNWYRLSLLNSFFGFRPNLFQTTFSMCLATLKASHYANLSRCVMVVLCCTQTECGFNLSPGRHPHQKDWFFLNLSKNVIVYFTMLKCISWLNAMRLLGTYSCEYFPVWWWPSEWNYHTWDTQLPSNFAAIPPFRLKVAVWSTL